jgi:hypothetical protein
MANLTLEIDDALLREARVLAARRGISLSRLAAEKLAELVREDRGYEAARRRAVKRLERGFALDWGPPVSRDQLHER